MYMRELWGLWQYRGGSCLCFILSFVTMFCRLAECALTDKSCGIVATVLQSPNSLTELDLSNNVLGDSGIQLLCKGLSSPHCKLQTLRLVLYMSLLSWIFWLFMWPFDCLSVSLRLCNCRISNDGYVCLALTLMLNPSCVKQLDVSNNHPGESAQKLLTSRLEDPHRKVEALQYVLQQ